MGSSDAQRFLLAAAALRESGNIRNPFPKPSESINEYHPTSPEVGDTDIPYVKHTLGCTSSDGESISDSDESNTYIDKEEEESVTGESDGMNISISSYLRALAEDETWVSAVEEKETDDTKGTHATLTVMSKKSDN